MNRPPPQLGPTVQTVDVEELYSVISGATSQNSAVAPSRVYDERFKQMLDMTGTFDGLSDIASQKSVPLAIRLQSIIQFKNHAFNHWRSRKLLSAESRARIRSRCLNLLDEENDMIARYNQDIMGRISRTDFPASWPNLLTDLMLVIETNLQARYSSPAADPRTMLMLRRSIGALDKILSEFVSMKMPSAIATTKNIFVYLHQTLYTYYERISSTFSSSLNPGTITLPRTAEDILLAHLLYECLYHLATWAWGRQGKEDFEPLRPWFYTVFQYVGLQRRILTESRSNILKETRSSSTPLDRVARQSICQLGQHTLRLGEFFRRLQQLSPIAFVGIPTCKDVVLYGWNNVVEATNAPSDFILDSEDAVYPTKHLVEALVLFKESLTQWSTKPKKGITNPDTLSQQFVEDAVKLLVTKLLPLNPADLEGWMADPEEWVNGEDKESDQWQYDLRPCAERVLMTLCQHYTEYVVPLLEITFKQTIGQPTVDLSSVLQKEALYCALGRCSTRLQDVIPFDRWLEHSLSPESRDTNPAFPIIKRRIAWLIGQWISTRCSSINNPLIWEVLVHLLQDRGPGTDAVVRFTAATAVKDCVDNHEFDINVFAPYLAVIITELVKLTEEADTLESKRRVASSLETSIQRAEIRIIPHIPIISSAVPQYWLAAENDSTDKFTFKITLLNLVEALLKACKEHSATLGGIVVPLVRESLSPKNTDALDEHGVNLWQAALRNTVTIESVNGAPALLELFPQLMQLLAVNTDLLGKIISLVESYFILGATLVLRDHALDFFRALLTALKNELVVSINITDMIIALGLAMQLAPSSQWGEAMHISGLFPYVIEFVLDNESSAQQTTQFLYVLGRIAISDPKIFLQLMKAKANSNGAADDSKIFSELMDVWWARFDNMAEPRQRKLTAMAIASLVSTGHPEVLKRLSGEIFNLWTDVLCELQEVFNQAALDGTSSPIHRYWDQDEPPSAFYKETEDTPEFDRRHALFENDPVRTTLLSGYLAARLQEAEAACGGPQALQAMYLKDVDPTVMTQIQAYLSKA